MGGVGLDSNNLAPATIKFLCSYGGKILPRHPDGKLRYLGGHTRVLAVDRSISFAELLVKLGELCGTPVSLRCQLPTEDLDALVSITSDEDLANLIEEYDLSPSLPKIRAFLSPPKSTKQISPPSSIPSSSSSKPSSPQSGGGSTPRFSMPVTPRCYRQNTTPAAFPVYQEKSSGKMPQYAYHAHRNSGQIYLIHNGNHWQ